MTNKNNNLVLTRKVGDRVKIYTPGSEICTITVTNISQKACKLAFEANPSIRIDREEIYKKGDINGTKNNISKSKKTTS